MNEIKIEKGNSFPNDQVQGWIRKQWKPEKIGEQLQNSTFHEHM